MRLAQKDWLWYGALLALGAVLYLVCRFFPADLPFWLPWEFSWPIFLAIGLTIAWFVRGLTILPKDQHPPLWRLACFCAGRGQFLHRPANPHRLLRPAYVLRASLGAFRPAA